MRRQRLSAVVWDRTRNYSVFVFLIRSLPARTYKMGFGFCSSNCFRELYFYNNTQVLSFLAMFQIYFANFIEESLLSNCLSFTMLGLHGQCNCACLWSMENGNTISENPLNQMSTLVFLICYAFLKVWPFETLLLDYLDLLWNRLLECLWLQATSCQIYVLQISYSCSNCHHLSSIVWGD